MMGKYKEEIAKMKELRGGRGIRGEEERNKRETNKENNDKSLP